VLDIDEVLVDEAVLGAADLVIDQVRDVVVGPAM